MTPETRFRELAGYSSLKGFGLMVVLENEYHRPVSISEFAAMSTIRDLAAAGCRDLPPYSCRHTTATALAITKNIAPQTVTKIMRWSSAKMLDRYAHPDQKDALKAVNRIKKPKKAAF